MVDASGNTVTHEFYPGSGRGGVRPAKGCARALYCLAPEVPIVGGTSEAREREREAPRSLLEEEMIEASANIGIQKSVCAL